MEIWSFMFNIFGIQWVIPGGVPDLLACWGNSCHSIRIRKVWDMVPLCVFWCIWWERNSRSFEGKERNLMEVKGTVLRTLLDWSKAAGIISFSSVLDFLDYCIAWVAVLCFLYTSFVHVFFSFAIILLIYW